MSKMQFNNTQHFDAFYNSFKLAEPSPFSKFIAETFITKKISVIELGCGNGRDGSLLMGGAKKYIGIDRSTEAIKQAVKLFNKSTVKSALEPTLLACDIVDFDFARHCDASTLIYSRFFLHSITAKYEKIMFQQFLENTQRGTIFAFECRTIYDDLYGKGERLGLNTFKTDHVRRFINPINFYNQLIKNFKVIDFKIGDNFARHLEMNPIVMRIIFSKK